MKYHTAQSGFSLVETLVSITILLLVIIGPMTISRQTAKSSSFASEQVVAFFLAQEGAELVQKARDDLLVRHFSGSVSNPWADFSDTAGTYQLCYASAGCGLQLRDRVANLVSEINTPRNCSTLSNCALYLSSASTRTHYTHTFSASAVATPYTRRIYLTRVNANEVKVISRVTWRTGSLKAEQKVEVESRLFNIYGQ